MNNPNRFIDFEGWKFDVVNGDLIAHDGRVASLGNDKDSRILKCLVDKTGQIVRKEELLTSGWGDITVGENNLNHAIGRIRGAFRTLGFDPEQVIKTEHGRGYRFLLSPFFQPPEGVQNDPLPAVADLAIGKRTPWVVRLMVVATSCALLAGVLAFTWYFLVQRRQRAQSHLGELNSSKQPEETCKRSPIRVVVATLDAKDEDKYKVTDFLSSNIRAALKDEKEIIVDVLGRPIRETDKAETPDQVAMAEHASLLIWGFYVKTSNRTAVTVYLKPQKSFGLFLHDRIVPIYASNALDRLEVHQDLSDSLTNLSTLVAAMIHMEKGDAESASRNFISFLSNQHIPKGFVNLGMVYLTAANAEFRLGHTRKAVDLWNSGMRLIPDAEAQEFLKWIRNVMLFDKFACPHRPREGAPTELIAVTNLFCDLTLADQSSTPDKARGYLDSALKDLRAVPGGEKQYQLQGQIYLNKGDQENALLFFNKAIQSSPCDGMNYLNRGHIWRSKQDFTLATHDYSTSIALAPLNKFGYLFLGFTHLDQHNREAALNDFRKGFEITKDASLLDEIVKTELAEANDARAHHESSDKIKSLYDSARAGAIEEIHARPNAPEAHILLGRVYEATGNFKAAADEFRIAVKDSPRPKANLYSQLGCTLVDLGRYEAARPALEKAVQLDPEEYKPFDCLAHLNRRTNKPLVAIEQLNKAINALKTEQQRTVPEIVVSTDESIPHLIAYMYEEIADILASLGSYDSALEQLDNAAKYDATHEANYTARSSSHMHQGKFREAKDDCTKAIAVAPNDAVPYSMRAMFEVMLGELSSAKDDYKKAIQLNPDGPDSYTYRGKLDELNGDLQLAENDYGKAIAASPGNAMKYFDRMEVFRKEKKYKNAISDGKEGVKLMPKDPFYHFVVGQLYEDAGDSDSAITQYGIATELSGHPDPKLLLKLCATSGGANHYCRKSSKWAAQPSH